ncbi:MAG: Vitamin B12 dependent methionine synthase activation subunit [Christensenella sp.]|jgi:hypothetical protein|nr:Vitamin B12 dependent methionine synthase activation subunit [Christensenella sp.]
MKFREEEALRYLGAKGAPDEQTSALLRDAAAQLDAIATPRHAVLRVRAELSGTRVTLGAFQADCAALAAHLAGCGAAYLFAATLGAEVDRAMARLAKLDVARAFALQACAASALECFCDDTCAALAQECAAEGLYLRPRFSPGYSGFSVVHQTDLLRALQADKRLGLAETDSHMLTPLKSVTAVIGLCPEKQPCPEHKCALCDHLTCNYRKEPQK